MKVSFSLFLAALVAGVSASNVIDLTPDNFDSVIGKGKPGLVELCVSCVQQKISWANFIFAQLCSVVVRLGV